MPQQGRQILVSILKETAILIHLGSLERFCFFGFKYTQAVFDPNTSAKGDCVLPRSASYDPIKTRMITRTLALSAV